MARKDELSPKQARFVQEYLIDPNGARAARRAGYSAHSAHVQASQLLTLPKVQSAVAAGRQQAHEHAGIDAEMITRELGRLAFANIADILSWDQHGRITITASAELSPEVLAAVAEISETESKSGRSVLRVKMHSKTTAMELLTRNRTIEELAAKVDALTALVNAQQAQGIRSNGYVHTR